MGQRPDYLKIFKTAAGAGLAIALAEAAGLKYSASAGVITLLSIQDTKKETIRIMGKRLLSFGVSLILAQFCFKLAGYTPFSVCLFLLLFTPFSIHYHMEAGISVNTVLMTHFLAEKTMGGGAILNEALLLLTGAGMGLILNLYMPGKKKRIWAMQRRIEEQMKQILEVLSYGLKGSDRQCACGPYLAELAKELAMGEKSAFEEMENNLLSETRYYLRYMNMRKNQAAVLGEISDKVCKMEFLPVQAKAIAEILSLISLSFHEYNNALGLLERLFEVKASMKEEPLPENRREFENRAALFHILLKLEEFLVIKRDFVASLTMEEIEKFWEEKGRLSDEGQ